MLSRKDYKAIAEIIKDNTHEQFALGGNTVWLSKQYTCRDLADYFEQDNPQFDRDRFMEACRLQAYACESCSQIKTDVEWREETEQYECRECYELWMDENGL